MDRLLQSHDAGVRPTGNNGADGPVTVTVNMALRSVTSVSDYDMDFGVQIFLRQEWVDERLKYENKGNIKYLSLPDPVKVWTPDVFISNEKDSHLHKLMSPNTFLRIYPSGHVVYSARLSLTLWCHMRLERFPFDTQQCLIRLEPYGSTTADLKFLWKVEDPVQLYSDIKIMGFTMEKVLTTNFTASTLTGEYNVLVLKLFFKRDLKYYVIHSFLPSTVLVAVSWTSFWMDRRAVVARILLVLSTLFAMSSLTTDIEASVPHVSYVKAMDLWAGACFTFLLAALVEFAIVNATSPDEREPSKEVRNPDGSTTVDMKPLVRKSTESSEPPSKPNSKDTEAPFYKGILARLPKDPHRIDSTARVLFPSAFILFFAVYFLVYLFFDRSNQSYE